MQKEQKEKEKSFTLDETIEQDRRNETAVNTSSSNRTNTSSDDSDSKMVIIPISGHPHGKRNKLKEPANAHESNNDAFPIYLPQEEDPQKSIADDICATTLKKLFPLEIWVEICSYLNKRDEDNLLKAIPAFKILYALPDVAKQSLINEKNELTAKRGSLAEEIAKERRLFPERMALNSSVRKCCNSPGTYIVLGFSALIEIIFAAFFFMPKLKPKNGSPMTHDQVSLLYHVNSYMIFCMAVIQMFITCTACSAERRNASAMEKFSIWRREKKRNVVQTEWKIGQVDTKLAKTESLIEQRSKERNDVANVNEKNEKETTDTPTTTSSTSTQKNTL